MSSIEPPSEYCMLAVVHRRALNAILLSLLFLVPSITRGQEEVHGSTLLSHIDTLGHRDTLDGLPPWCNLDEIVRRLDPPFGTEDLPGLAAVAEARVLAWYVAEEHSPAGPDRITRNLMLWIVYHRGKNKEIPCLVIVRSEAVAGNRPLRWSSWRMASTPEYGVYLTGNRFPAPARYPIVEIDTVGVWHRDVDDIAWRIPTIYEGKTTVIYLSAANIIKKRTLVDVLGHDSVVADTVNWSLRRDLPDAYRIWMPMNRTFFYGFSSVTVDTILRTMTYLLNTDSALRIVGFFEFGKFGKGRQSLSRKFIEGSIRTRTWLYIFGAPPVRRYLPQKN